MASVKTYNSRLVTVALGTHSVTGFADDSFITIEPPASSLSGTTPRTKAGL